MAAARQNEMNDNMTVVATTTLVVVDLDTRGERIDQMRSLSYSPCGVFAGYL